MKMKSVIKKSVKVKEKDYKLQRQMDRWMDALHAWTKNIIRKRTKKLLKEKKE